ncbi:MAG: type II toxin-antitoxin system Phd/YefM family antitoxin [Gammaproteobacteria bacterium]|nr:type II toxin-antitoxin system Phd/YefM family antitoxin [Gammaproteobacteria bacterium]
MSANKSKVDYWQLAEAKNRFSEVARSALSEGPQKIYRRDGNVVVISESEYLQLKAKLKHPDFKAFLLHSTPDLEGLDLTRDESPMRKIDL